jgi:hypothetical protein
MQPWRNDKLATMLPSPSLEVALAGLDEEVAALAAFDAARDSLVDLIEVRADPAAIVQALQEVYERLEDTRTAYFHLEELMISAGWSMEQPDTLPVELRRAIEAHVLPHQEHRRRTVEAEAVVRSWLNEQEWRHYEARRRHTEVAHTRRARRRPRRD